MTDQTNTAPDLAAIEVETIDRSAFLVKGMLAAGALMGAGAISPFVSRAFAQEDTNDVDILNFALTLEYLEAAFYDQAKAVKGVSDEVKGYIKDFGAEEQEHVDGLTQAIKDLGGKPVKAPGVDFGDAFSSPKKFTKLAITFEDTGVSAYNGAGPKLKSKELLATAGSIVQVEARHAGAIRLAAGENPAPNSFDPSLTMDEVLEAVKPFITS
jgi:rubrerythrin